MNLHPKLAKIQGLIDKAASTEFEEEREALQAKAEELMATYRVDRAMLAMAKTPEERTQVVTRRLNVGSGVYNRARLALLANIASANECSTVTYTSYEGRMVDVIGTDDDADTVVFLYTSLLAQATAEGARVTGSSKAETRSMRRSFLWGFASAIRDRLREQNRKAVEQAEESSSVALVLVDKKTRVDDYVKSRWPRLGTMTSVAPIGDGYSEGFRAGQRADLSIAPKVSGSKGAISA